SVADGLLQERRPREAATILDEAVGLFEANTASERFSGGLSEMREILYLYWHVTDPKTVDRTAARVFRAYGQGRRGATSRPEFIELYAAFLGVAGAHADGLKEIEKRVPPDDHAGRARAYTRLAQGVIARHTNLALAHRANPDLQSLSARALTEWRSAYESAQKWTSSDLYIGQMFRVWASSRTPLPPQAGQWRAGPGVKAEDQAEQTEAIVNGVL